MKLIRSALDRRAMAILSIAHVCDDVNQSFLPAILPFLVSHRGMTYAAAATIVFAGSASSSVVQPLIGWLADRVAMPWLIAAGVFCAGAGVALIGVAPTYETMLAAAFVSGLGVAAFHPEAGRFANFVAGERKASGMRWFAAGGNAGFALGPLFATATLAAFGLRGTLLALIPVSLSAASVVGELPRLRAFQRARAIEGVASRADDWAGFARLSAFVIVRSMAFFGLLTFVPLFCSGVLHATPEMASLALSVMLVGGIAGTLAGGSLADRFGRITVLVWSSAATAIALGIFLAGEQIAPSLPFAFVMAAAIGFAIVSSQTSYVVLGQQYLPNRLGLASGVTFGLAVSLGGVATPLLGAIADAHGVSAALEVTALLCVLAFAAAVIMLNARSARK